jgi:hypothetical protein
MYYQQRLETPRHCVLEEISVLKIIGVATWEEFTHHLVHLTEKRKGQPDAKPLLFRGQSNSSWELATTLDRLIHAELHCLSEYYGLIQRIASDIEMFTVHALDCPSAHEVAQFCRTYDCRHAFSCSTMPAFSYMIYLRHHGFPSPLLDWTYSPYNAAYFAFAKCGTDHTVAIYVLQEANQAETMQGVPRIYSLCRNIRSHKRHFLQRSAYTICVNFVGNHWQLSKYRDMNSGQDEYTIIKFVIPMSEKVKVLKFLYDVNIHAASLFGSDESLMETLKFREFHVRALL